MLDGTRQALDPFEYLSRWSAANRRESLAGLPPFQGGIAGYLGYELGRWIERLPVPALDEFTMPDLALGVYDWVVSWDHSQNRAWLVGPANRIGPVLDRLQRDTVFDKPLSHGRTITPQRLAPLADRPEIYSNFTRGQYEEVVRRAIDYIHAGDCFQVNIAQRLLTRASESPIRLYDRLRQKNPAPFAGYFDAGEVQIMSASPERFMHLSPEGKVTTRPIKGTRPRGASDDADHAVQRELLASAKDRAENVMIVDLLRNDLGRVCDYGTVRADDVCMLESFATVHHLVSEVRGSLRPGAMASDLLRASFPGGSVTGAPKIRAMQIIAELEATARGPYCGCLGWLGWDGAMDTNILIRTFVQAGGWLQFSVGGGIVADSSPQREYDETMHKAKGMLMSLPENSAVKC
jgi:para-aminobenzoate synthetase component 1